ncbi:hypothetical protein D3C79_1050820 [compost metagenome]
MINTPAQTITKASKVPMLVISPTTRMGTNAAKRLTNTANKILDFHGVLHFVCTSEKTFGNNPSLLIEKNTRDCANKSTSITEVSPIRMAKIIA